jgi:PEGA domain
MASTRFVIGTMLACVLAAGAAFADDGQRGHGRGRQREAAQEHARASDRAVPRSAVAPRTDARVGPRTDIRVVPSARVPYYRSRTVIVPRIIRPRIVTVVPYRPYVYRPSLAIGVLYGSGGAYPYGYTPRAYYDPIPGRPYGGLRITGAPRDAHVFADGYYVGIVNDFDGVFQHLNLVAGPHRIEIEEPGYEPVAFDVMVQPQQTVTLRADMAPC